MKIVKIVLLCCFLSGCADLSESYVRADLETYEFAAPKLREWAETKDKEWKEVVDNKLMSWQARASKKLEAVTK